ncbi:MAG: protein kinase [Sandaracinaceae bacterium]|nr:protein kinase [Sandaracinaceae bacterium]
MPLLEIAAGLVDDRRMSVDDGLAAVRLDPGALVEGRYRVIRELGRGGMGAVYLAEDVALERRVAIKLARSELTWGLTRFRREAAALAAIRDEHVVAVHAFGHHEGVPFFVMEHIDGEDLASIIAVHRRARAETPLYRAIEIIAEVARGLAAVHASGVLHADIKAENIVIERGSGRAVLVDFGLAHDAHRELGRVASVDDTLDGTEPMLGTPQYVAPELYWNDGARPTAQSDIYALAVVAHELMTGVVPFDAPDALSVLELQRDAPLRPPSELRPALAPLDALFAAALAKDPAVRPATAAAFAARLEHAAKEVAEEVPDARISDPPSGEIRASDVPRILVIEDEPIFARLATRCAQIAFGGAPVEVVTVGSGPEAVARARRRVPQLVLLDYDLPELNGVEVLSRIRALPGGEDTEVLVVRAEAEAAERWRFGILGVRDFQEKPVDVDILVARIADLARRRGLTRRDLPAGP